MIPDTIEHFFQSKKVLNLKFDLVLIFLSLLRYGIENFDVDFLFNLTKGQFYFKLSLSLSPLFHPN